MTLVQTSETSTLIINRDFVRRVRPRYLYPYDLPHLGYTRRRGASSIVHSALGHLPPTGNPRGGRCGVRSPQRACTMHPVTLFRTEVQVPIRLQIRHTTES